MTAKNKPVENKDLVMEVREKIDERDSLGRETDLVWVKGHSGDAGNAAADKLAIEGARLGRAVIKDIGEEEEVERAELTEEISHRGGDAKGPGGQVSPGNCDEFDEEEDWVEGALMEDDAAAG